MRIFAVSDLHTDFQENWLLLTQLPDTEHQEDVLIVAGDIADGLEAIQGTLALLRAKFLHVFYTPGNHELWARNGAGNSVEKLSRVLDLCDVLGIHTRPARVGACWVVPLFSWYDPSFDVDNSADMVQLAGWSDFPLCKWPQEIGGVAEFFLKMNEVNLKDYDASVISFSHFLPRRDLLPPTANLRFKGLPKVAGCLSLEDQIRRLHSSVHVFGHSHISCDRVIDRIRYVQNPLRYPRERAVPGFSLKMIWNSDDPLPDHVTA